MWDWWSDSGGGREGSMSKVALLDWREWNLCKSDEQSDRRIHGESNWEGAGIHGQKRKRKNGNRGVKIGGRYLNTVEI